MSDAGAAIPVFHRTVPVRTLRRTFARDRRPVRWALLAQDGALATRLDKELGSDFRRLQIGRELHESSKRSRADFVAWIDREHARYGRNPDWWGTAIAGRNTLVDPLFLHVCYLSVATALIARTAERPQFVVAGTYAMVDALRANLPECATVRIERQVVDRIVERAQQWGRAVVGPMHFMLAYALPSLWAARGSTPRISSETDRADVTVIKTFVHPSRLQRGATFEDRYLPGLADRLEQRGTRVLVLATAVDTRPWTREHVSVMRGNARMFLVPSDHLRWSDYLAAAFSGWRAARIPAGPVRVGPFDITRLVADARRRQAGAGAARHAALTMKVPDRLRGAGVYPLRMISWWENQWHDKALAFGARTAWPAAKQIGILNAPLAPSLLHLFPTRSECAAGAVPDRVVCSGPLPASLVREAAGVLDVAGDLGLRYAYVANGRPQTSRQAGPRLPFRVLILLPVDIDEAAEIVTVLACIIDSAEGTHWSIRPHPDYRLEDVLGAHSALLGERIHQADGPLAALFEETDVVVTGGSGVAIEAAAHGLPVIQIGRALALTHDPLGADPEAAPSLCFTGAEVRDALNHARRLSAADRDALVALGVRVRDRWFTPLSSNAIDALLD